MKVSVFKRTTDDWHPSYQLSGWNKGIEHQKLVEVMFTQTGPNPPVDGHWRVCAWGVDDFGLENDFVVERNAWDCFVEVIGLENVTMDALLDRGFVSA